MGFLQVAFLFNLSSGNGKLNGGKTVKKLTLLFSSLVLVVIAAGVVLFLHTNAPNAALLQQHYQDLPHKLQAQNIDPRVPWLYNFKLDFRFK